MRIALVLLMLILSRFSPAAELLFRLEPEYRLDLRSESSAFRRHWSSLGLGKPEACFPRHPAMHFPKGEKAFGPTDLSLLFRIPVPDSLATEYLRMRVSKIPGMAWAEWRRTTALPFSLPDDPAADSLQGSQRQVLKKISAYAGWEQSRGDSSVLIGLLDTGTPVSHEDLAGNLFRNAADPVNGMDDDGNGLVDDFTGWDFGGNDNNPSPDNTGTSPGHGTSVSSLAGAVCNNSLGIAGIGWNCRILPVKIWQWNGSFSNFSGYEAMVYAADMGCRVINCSWGAAGSVSQYEQDIIRYVTFNKGALVVAAGGNTAGYHQVLPANYDYALGVSMTDTSDRIFWAASRHYKLDLMAPGVGVFGIKTDGSYGWVEGGTSMSAPMAAGAAGLVLARHPQLSGLQAGELLRVNSDTIYSLPGNAGYRDQTGRGRLNIRRALNRENRISLRAVDCLVNGLARPGDTLKLALRFENYLDSVPGFSVRLFSASADLVMVSDLAGFGGMGSMTELSSPPVFTALVNPSLNGRKEVAVRAEVSCGTYRDSRWFTLQLNAGWLRLDSNEVEITLVENGRVGFADFAGNYGNGIRYRGIQLSADAGLMLGTAPDKVADCVFSTSTNNLNFRAENRLQYQTYPGLSQHAVFHFNDSLAGNQASGIGIKQSAFESTAGDLQSCAFISYQVKNRNPFALDSLCLGMYNDWECGNPERNASQWNDSLQFLLTRPQGRGKMAATMVLGAGEIQVFAIDAVPDTAGNNINLFDGFSKAEKWKCLSSGKARTMAGGSSGANVVQVCGMKWRQFLPGETRKLAFAFLFADSLPELIQKAVNARRFFRKLNTSPGWYPEVQDFCEGDTFQASWAGAARAAVFSDSAGLNPVFEGNGFSPWVYSDTSWYVSGRDSLYPGPLQKLSFRKNPLPEVFLSCNCPAGDTILIGTTVSFNVSGSPGARSWFRNGGIVPGPVNSCCHSFTPEQSGPFTVCVEITDSLSGCRKRVCRELQVQTVTQAGELLPGFRLYPNPAGEELTLEIPAEAEISLFDLAGRKLLHAGTKPGLNILSLRSLPPGMYRWKLNTPCRTLQGKLLKE